MKVYHSLNKNNCLTDLKTSKDGLTSKEAQKRLEKYGKNELVEAKRKSLVRRFFEQLKEMMKWLSMAGNWVSTKAHAEVANSKQPSENYGNYV